MARRDHCLITCEHGGNRIPPRYRTLFTGFEALLESHRGYDPGALALARQMAKTFAAPLFVSTTSRLLIDLNRSIGHPKLYSEATRGAPAAVRREILDKHVPVGQVMRPAQPGDRGAAPGRGAAGWAGRSMKSLRLPRLQSRR